MIELIILTGVLGAGRTVAVQSFEEGGYCITDNIPIEVIDKYFDAIEENPSKYRKVALSVFLNDAEKAFKSAKKHKSFNVTFVGVTCSAVSLNERFRLTRKIHPKQVFGYSLEECINKDIEDIRKIRDLFDVFIDTTKLTKNEYRSLLFDTCIGNKHKFSVNFYSFGYKVSVPQDIETVFDVRLLPNPFWVPELKHLTGLDQEVKDFVLNAPETKEYLKHIIKYLNFYLENLKRNGRNHASIGIACSGGQHRSVVIANYLKEYYKNKYSTTVSHKDLPKK